MVGVGGAAAGLGWEGAPSRADAALIASRGPRQARQLIDRLHKEKKEVAELAKQNAMIEIKQAEDAQKAKAEEAGKGKAEAALEAREAEMQVLGRTPPP